ncbi:MAG: acylphosphatase [Phycisphaerae bacterium]
MHENSSNALRRTVLFSGTVQGVGFRFTARALASRFKVTGFVRNLPDGRVELVAEGSQREVDGFQEAVADAMRRYIDSVSLTDTSATDEFRSFTIVI